MAMEIEITRMKSIKQRAGLYDILVKLPEDRKVIFYKNDKYIRESRIDEARRHWTLNKTWDNKKGKVIPVSRTKTKPETKFKY